MRLIEHFNRHRFNRAVRAIDRTPALASGSSPFTVLSMVQQRDVRPYLLALKSLARFLAPERVVVVADPSLDRRDRETLRKHVPDIVIREVTEFRRPGIPAGGCWERLCAIAEYAADAYVVQLDADTVTTADIPEVAAAIRDRVSFVLGTEDGQDFVPCDVAAAWARTKLERYEHVQLLAEATLDRLEIDGIGRYVRGCAGFSGFAPGSFGIERVAAISRRMGALLGDRWSAWGTEQFASNLIVSNSPGARVLPHPRYCMPTVRSADTAFLHFIGYERHLSGLYASLARDIALNLSGLAKARR